MKPKRWMFVFVAMLLALSGTAAFAKHKDRDHDDERGRREYRYSRHDRGEMKAWYHHHRGDLPPGLAKRDRLPPGLERQLRVRGTLPPGLRDRIRPCPEGLVRMLPPPPPQCEHVLIGGSIVLLNRNSFVVLDIFHLVG